MEKKRVNPSLHITGRGMPCFPIPRPQPLARRKPNNPEGYTEKPLQLHKEKPLHCMTLTSVLKDSKCLCPLPHSCSHSCANFFTLNNSTRDLWQTPASLQKAGYLSGL